MRWLRQVAFQGARVWLTHAPVPTLRRSKGWGLEWGLGPEAAGFLPALAPGTLACLAEEDCGIREAGGQGPGDKEKEGHRETKKQPV